MKATRVLYLDLDGTVRHGYDELGRFVNRPEDVVIFPEALVLMKRAKEDGWRIVAISNQGGIALGHMTMDECADTMMQTYVLCDGLFDKMTWCRHHPEAADPEMAVCWCRKPLAGMVIETALALSELYPDEYYPPHLGLFVGDRPEDKACAQNASLPFVWASDWRAGAFRNAGGR